MSTFRFFFLPFLSHREVKGIRRMMWWERGCRSAACPAASGRPGLPGRSAPWDRDRTLPVGRACVPRTVGRSNFLWPCAGLSRLFALWLFIQCWPAEKIWDTDVTRASCIHSSYYYHYFFFLPAGFVVFSRSWYNLLFHESFICLMHFDFLRVSVTL